MEFKDVPREELTSGKFSSATIKTLLFRRENEFRSYVKASATKWLLPIIAILLCACAIVTGYAVANGESPSSYAVVYCDLILAWLPVIFAFVIKWRFTRPTVRKLLEDLDLYRQFSVSPAPLEP